MTFYIDADSCAKEARIELQRVAERTDTRLILVANRNIPFDTKSPLFLMKICEKQKDAADDYIFGNALPGDIAVTRDLILADRLIKKNVTVINDKGTVFSRQNIEYMLEERELSLQMKSLGVATGGKMRQYGQKDLLQLKKTLSEIME